MTTSLMLTILAVAAGSDPIATINASRAARGVPPLVASPALQVVADSHAAAMAATRSMAHVGQDGGPTLADRLRTAGYPAASSYDCVDLLSTGSQPAGLDYWPPSAYGPGYTGPTHYGELHSPKYTHVGFAYRSPFSVAILARGSASLVRTVARPSEHPAAPCTAGCPCGSRTGPACSEGCPCGRYGPNPPANPDPDGPPLPAPSAPANSPVVRGNSLPPKGFPAPSAPPVYVVTDAAGQSWQDTDGPRLYAWVQARNAAMRPAVVYATAPAYRVRSGGFRLFRRQAVSTCVGGQCR